MSVGSCEKRHWDTGQLHRQHRIGCCWVGLKDLIRSTCYSDNENLLVIGDTLYLDLESLEEEAYEFLFIEQIYLIEIHLKCSIVTFLTTACPKSLIAPFLQGLQLSINGHAQCRRPVFRELLPAA